MHLHVYNYISQISVLAPCRKANILRITVCIQCQSSFVLQSSTIIASQRNSIMVIIHVFIDRNSIPLVYDLFPGYDSKIVHMLPIFDRRAVTAANRRLNNTSDKWSVSFAIRIRVGWQGRPHGLLFKDSSETNSPTKASFAERTVISHTEKRHNARGFASLLPP